MEETAMRQKAQIARVKVAHSLSIFYTVFNLTAN